MNGRIKLVALDLDGTVLTDEKQVTPYTMNVLRKAAEKGVEVVISTGRPICAVPEKLRTIPGIRYALTANGARVVSFKTMETLYEELLPLEKAEQILRVLYEYNSHKEIFIDGKGYCDRETYERLPDFHPRPSSWDYVRSTRSPVDNVMDFLRETGKPVDKINTVFATREEHERGRAEIQSLPGYEVTGSYERNLEVNEAGVDKGKSLLKLGALLGIRKEEIMACGDGLNDLGMIKAAGFGVAMGNAISEVKNAADFITDTNEEDGAARAIERFVLQREGE